MNIFECILNGITILLAILSLIISIRVNNKQKKIKLRENYYEPVFKEMMTVKYPIVFTDFINIEEKQVYKNQSDNFESLILEFRKKIRYMMFTSPEIYKEITDILIEIDDLIVLLYTKEENRVNNINEIEQLSKKLYKTIENYFINP